MESLTAVQSALSSKYERVKKASAGFGFFVSVHDFVEYIESSASFDGFLKGKITKQRKEIPLKYSVLLQIYQGIEDIDLVTTADLGHDRYVAIRELSLIRKNETSENNSLWKRREVTRKVTGEVYKILDAHLSGAVTA